MGVPDWWEVQSTDSTPKPEITPAEANGNETPPPAPIAPTPSTPRPPQHVRAERRQPATVDPGKYRLVLRTQPLQWTGRKVAVMSRDLLQMLYQQGAPNCEFIIEGIDGDVLNAPEEKLYLHLQCKPCGEKTGSPVEWYASSFTPCIKCGEKTPVKKRTIKRVPLPKGVSPVA